jgi:hypothetical protein
MKLKEYVSENFSRFAKTPSEDPKKEGTFNKPRNYSTSDC